MTELVFWVFFFVTVNFPDQVSGADTLAGCNERRSQGIEAMRERIPDEPVYVSPCQRIELKPLADSGLKT